MPARAAPTAAAAALRRRERSAEGSRTAAGAAALAANEFVEIRNDPAKGRGIFARVPIAAGTLIEAAPVIVVSAEQCALLDKTILHDYYFCWDDTPGGGGGRGAVALGLVSLCNHSHRRPRARVRRNEVQGTLDLVALAPIAAGDEITIDYDCPLWFAAQE